MIKRHNHSVEWIKTFILLLVDQVCKRCKYVCIFHQHERYVYRPLRWQSNRTLIGECPSPWPITNKRNDFWPGTVVHLDHVYKTSLKEKVKDHGHRKRNIFGNARTLYEVSSVATRTVSNSRSLTFLITQVRWFWCHSIVHIEFLIRP